MRGRSEQTTVHCVVESAAKAKRLFEQILSPSLAPVYYYESILHQGGMACFHDVVPWLDDLIFADSIQMGSFDWKRIYDYPIQCK